VARYLFQLTSVTPAGSYVRLDSASGSTSPTAVSPLDSAYVVPGAVLRSDVSTGALPTVAAGVATVYQKTLDAAGAVTATATLTGTLVDGAGPGSLPAQTWPIPVNTDPTGLGSTYASRPGDLELVDYWAYGHSYPQGYGLSAAGQAYPARVGKRISANTTTNKGVGGVFMPGAFHYLLGWSSSGAGTWTPGTKALVSLDATINEVIQANPANSAQDITGYTNALTSSLRYLSARQMIPYSDASVTLGGGTWTTTTPTGLTTAIKKFTGTGGTITITGVTDTEIGLLLIGFLSIGSTVTVTVGGTTYATLNTAGVAEYTGAIANNYQWNLFRVTGMPAGTKTIVCTITGGTADTYFGAYTLPGTTPPSIVYVRDPQLASYTGGGGTYTKTQGDAQLAALHAAADTVLASAEFSGRVVVADPGPSFTSAMFQADGVHPNGQGARVIADKIEAAARTLPYRIGLQPS
jgi:hypothetical protein